ncbi:uncharacterized protein LOC130689476 [Daphnia carinata]|uniref:uncharacterized protein LOC130689476 n=1 Tax=Daphnia carinata TaxID=120202 RepID=UPI00257E26E7|nr:uncharacterized protein LOC130689476 [Daphnia carinata]
MKTLTSTHRTTAPDKHSEFSSTCQTSGSTINGTLRTVEIHLERLTESIGVKHSPCIWLLSFLFFPYWVQDIAIQTEACIKTLYVEDTALIDVAEHQNCILQIETDQNHVLRFSLAHSEHFERAQEFVSIYDGIEDESPIIRLENQIRHEVGLTHTELLDSVYTTKSAAHLRLKKPTLSLKLKIEKAVNCPFNLGSESQCGRVVDGVACYCATFTKRGQSNHTTYCRDNGMKLLAIQDLNEEEKLYAAWGTLVYFWTSASHNKTSGTWSWEGTMANIYPGYANWAPFKPNNTLTDGTCMAIKNGWYDDPCVNLYDAICELQPEDVPNSTTPFGTPEPTEPPTVADV